MSNQEKKLPCDNDFSDSKRGMEMLKSHSECFYVKCLENDSSKNQHHIEKGTERDSLREKK